MKLYMAVTADKYELPIDFGTSKELGKKFGVSEITVRTSAKQKRSGKEQGYKFILVEIPEENKYILKYNKKNRKLSLINN